MKKIITIFVIIVILDIVNSLPAVQSSTPIFEGAPSTSTEKLSNGPPSVTTETKVGKEVPTVQTLEDGSIKPSEISKEATTKLTNEEHKIEPTTSKTLLSESKTPITAKPSAFKSDSKVSTPPSGQKPEPQETTTSSSGHKEETISLSLGHKGEPTTISTAHNGQTTTKPIVQNKSKQATKTNKKSMKTSTAYIDEGKVVIFNGICGPEGCEIEGDVYDELVPIAQAKKHG